MSLEEWGTLLLTVDSFSEAGDAIIALNVALSAMPLSHDERMAIEFHSKTIPGKKDTVYIYAKNLPSRVGETFW